MMDRLKFFIPCAALVATAALRVNAQDPTLDKLRLIGPHSGGSLTRACTGDPNTLTFPLNQGVWTVVPFSANGAQGSGPANPADPLQRNDDDFAQCGVGMPAVPFNFDLYGNTFTGNTIFINNNGNLSFGAGFTSFTSTGFPINNFPMVAPFWADVDTRNAASGVCYYQFRDDDSSGTAECLVVTWDKVGYFASQADKCNTFQVAISNGTNPIMGLGVNVCFSYDDMAWTTGSASGGVGGFGGTPATVGANRGDGVDFFQIGRFDHEGIDYDGPFGNPDGVSFLDGQHTCFNSSTTNIPPIPINFPAGNTVTLDVNNNDVLNLTVQFISPEPGQTTTVGINDANGAQAAGLVIVNAPGNTAVIDLDWTPDCGDAGTYVLDFTATDDFVPPGVTNISLTIIVLCANPNQPPVCPTGVTLTLWPPNHGYNTIDLNVVGGVTDPDGDPITYSIDTITQDEPVNAHGDGDTTCDGVGIGLDTALIRAERQGGGNGRVYNINYTASDGNGGSCTGTVTITVPHSQNGAPAIDDGQIYDSTQCFNAADLDANGRVDVADLLWVISDWGLTGPDDTLNMPDADTNLDGIVNVYDLVTIITNWTM